jgi:hypothetical protein
MTSHCKSEAEKTDRASALFLADADGGESGAEHQLSLLFGHISLSSTAAMKQSREALEGWFDCAS